VKATFRNILVPLGICWFIALFVAGFLAYFVSTTGTPPTDGLGRPLSEAPLLMRLLFGQERMWAGWVWFLAEMVIFWGSIALAVNISKWLDDDR
jgi:hypothetical protein